MKTVLALVLIWLVAGFGAVAGSILGNAAGKTGLFAGAVIGGMLTTAAAVMMATRFTWIPRASRKGAMAGALVGFAIAAPIAATNLHTPVVPVAVTSLAGIGALVGSVLLGRSSGTPH